MSNNIGDKKSREIWRAPLIVLVLCLAVCSGQQPSNHDAQPIDSAVKVSGCVVSMNGSFKLVRRGGPVYILKGDHSSLFSYNGMLVTVTGTIDVPDKNSSAQGIPVVLHVTNVKKVHDGCE